MNHVVLPDTPEEIRIKQHAKQVQLTKDLQVELDDLPNSLEFFKHTMHHALMNFNPKDSLQEVERNLDSLPDNMNRWRHKVRQRIKKVLC